MVFMQKIENGLRAVVYVAFHGDVQGYTHPIRRQGGQGKERTCCALGVQAPSAFRRPAFIELGPPPALVVPFV